jgi:rare lipoprotein A
VTRPLGSKLTLCVFALAALAAVPTAAAGDPPTGGVAAPPPPATEGVISASGPQVAIATRAGTMRGKIARFRGSVPTQAAGRRVAIERFDQATQAWTAVARTTVARDGRYVARWRAKLVGEHRIRAVLYAASQASAANASPELSVTVHRPAVATWYGPGFYGRTTACGVKMTRTLLGVAHKTLPCGTKVTLRHNGRRVRVPVIDRGPYSGAREYDLTAATARKLGFRGHGGIQTTR